MLSKKQILLFALSIVFAVGAILFISQRKKEKIVICKLTIDPFYEMQSGSRSVEVSLSNSSNPEGNVQSKFLDSNLTATFTDLTDTSVGVSFRFHKYFLRLRGGTTDFDTIQKVTIHDSLTIVELAYPFLSEFRCPKCRRYDQVIPIKTGIGVPSRIGSKIVGVDYVDGGCTASRRWYCKRDSTEF
ncbi:MAG: hypothetical protein Q8916_03370 [Bacteroidota bacterium]|nr:hypothetical protein [Bacteroidota bacterium]MDP4229428.1 hypothetical protein [Bacteroidota bacterium]MDP4235936.1 hypothetical protein [Bacteroidota bacterium]